MDIGNTRCFIALSYGLICLVICLAVKRFYDHPRHAHSTANGSDRRRHEASTVILYAARRSRPNYFPWGCKPMDLCIMMIVTFDYSMRISAQFEHT